MNQTVNYITNQRAAGGVLLSYLVTPQQSNSSIAVLNYFAVRGSEPPRHVHTMEDEVFIIEEGEMHVYLGEELIEAKAGDTVFLPRMVPHHFVIKSDYIKMTLIITPGNFGNYFIEMTTPFVGNTPPPVEEMTREQILKSKELTMQYRIHFV